MISKAIWFIQSEFFMNYYKNSVAILEEFLEHTALGQFPLVNATTVHSFYFSTFIFTKNRI